MELTYDNILAFLKEYIVAFSTLAQNPETTHEMHEYYAPEIKVTQYSPKKAVYNREQFLQFHTAHPGIQETLIPGHISIDERQKTAGVLLRGEFTIKKTKQVVVQTLSAHYTLMLDGNNTIKIKDIAFFVEAVPPGAPNIDNLYEESFKES